MEIEFVQKEHIPQTRYCLTAEINLVVIQLIIIAGNCELHCNCLGIFESVMQRVGLQLGPKFCVEWNKRIADATKNKTGMKYLPNGLFKFKVKGDSRKVHIKKYPGREISIVMSIIVVASYE